MRTAYAVLGVAWLVIIAGLYFFLTDKNTEVQDTVPMSSQTLRLTSTAFAEGAPIPSTYTCDGEQLSPPLSIAGVPAEAKSLALIVDDPDVPKQLKPDGVFDHWVLFNIPPQTTDIAAGGTAGTAGANGAGQNAYTGPCPPPQYEPSTHRYVFALYALDSMLPLEAGASKADVLKALEGHVIAQVRLTAKYKRQ
jgi:Raf kinase inhibitor-like YbhB/YbcL family protein